jgi:hypothetical protein
LEILVGLAINDAQAFQGTGIYVLNLDVTRYHLQVLQCWTARKVKKLLF